MEVLAWVFGQVDTSRVRFLFLTSHGGREWVGARVETFGVSFLN